MPDQPKRFTIAPHVRLETVAHLAPRFFREVLNLDYAEYLTTDESDLQDYTAPFGDHREEVEVLLDRFEAHYLLDGRVARSTRIVDLLAFLQSRGVST